MNKAGIVTAPNKGLNLVKDEIVPDDPERPEKLVSGTVTSSFCLSVRNITPIRSRSNYTSQSTDTENLLKANS